ncbi:hypothetical protein AMECASPLE_031227 [Ameca splendens]|uniref:Uncharacterized protein n=1 Tax=Ameca splendens TaxID=208324 RepID=A0ABV1AD85_9TELE
MIFRFDYVLEFQFFPLVFCFHSLPLSASNQLHLVHLHHAISLLASPALCFIYTLLFCSFLVETLQFQFHCSCQACSASVHAKPVLPAIMPSMSMPVSTTTY